MHQASRMSQKATTILARCYGQIQWSLSLQCFCKQTEMRQVGHMHQFVQITARKALNPSKVSGVCKVPSHTYNIYGLFTLCFTHRFCDCSHTVSCLYAEAFSIAQADGTAVAFAKSFSTVTKVGNCYGGGRVTAAALAESSSRRG